MPSSPRPCVATVLARKGHAELSQPLLQDFGRCLAATAPPRWLDPGLVADIVFLATPDALPGLREDLGRIVGSAPIDCVLQPLENRRKALFLADMDSTMIEQECIDELADMAGLKPHVAAITDRAMRGEIAFEPALRERVALLKGLPVTAIGEVLQTRITLTAGAKTLLRTLRRHGVYSALVSGGFTLFTGPIAAILGFDEHRSNVLLAEGGVLTGRVAEPILGRDAKRARLIELRTIHGLASSAILAVGDGANDLAMLGEAGLGVAFHAKPAVAAAASARIDHNDLEALLFIQGFARDAFA
jgi:phosphoserine phosphatase